MATYYIKNGGNDALDGLSDANAWQTVSKVNSFTFSPGDTVKFKRGGLWREELQPTEDGTLNDPINITSYGLGALPIITANGPLSGWTVPANWTETGAGTNIWYITYSNNVTRLWINAGAGLTEQRKARSLAGPAVPVLSALDTYYLDTALDRLYVYSADNISDGNPANEFTEMEVYIRPEALYLQTAHYWNVSEMDFRGGYYSFRVRSSNGILIHNCNIGIDSCFFGSIIETSNNVKISNCEINSNHAITSTWEAQYTQDGIKVFGDCNEIYISGNRFENWGHSAVYLLNLDSLQTNDHIHISFNEFLANSISYGRALNIDLTDTNCSDIKVYNNWIHDMPTQSQVNCYGIEFFNNIIDNIFGVAWQAGVACGLNISMYSLTTRPKGGKYYNNVFANCADEGIRINNYWGDAGYFIEENEFINNIFFNNDSTDNYQLTIQAFTGGWEKVLDNVYKNNLFYKLGVVDLINYRGVPRTVTEFNAENGNAWNEVISDNIEGDPLFVSSSDFSLQEGSPAIDAGLDVGLVSDFIGTLVPYGSAPDIGAYEWFEVEYDFSNITLVNTPACYNAVDNTIISRWVATECPINFTLLRRDWYTISSADIGGFLAINIYGSFTGNNGDVISVYDLTTNSMYTGTITDKSGDPVLITDIPYVSGMDIKYLNDHTLYAGYYFEGRLTINGVVESLTVIASPDSFGYADLDVSGILRIKTSIGKVTNYLSLIQKDTNKSGKFTLEYRGCWYGSNEAWISEGSTTSPASEVVWYYAECVRSEEQGCNLAEYVPTDLNDAPFLNQFDTPVYWYGLPFDLSFILPERAELSPTSDIIVTMKVYNSANVQMGADIVQTIDVDSLEGYVNSLNINSTLIDAGAAYFTVEIFSM